jgi:hypothetical protein
LVVWEAAVRQAPEETDLAGEVVVVVVEVEMDSMMILRHHTPIIDHRRSHRPDRHPRGMHRLERRDRGDQDSGLGQVPVLRLAMSWATEAGTRILAAYSVQVLRPEIPEDYSLDEQTMEKEVHGQPQDLRIPPAGMKAPALVLQVAGDLSRSRMK